jgi:amino acid adenylation domain-containing protein
MILPQFDVSLHVDETSSELAVAITFRTTKVLEYLARSARDVFVTVVGGIVADAERMAGDLDVLPKVQLNRLATLNAIPPPSTKVCIHELIEEHASNRPNSTAIDAWDGSMTFREVSRLSDRLAAHLSSFGVAEHQRVPLCFEKSCWTVVAMLAVLKVGAAFVPLSPQHPAKRHQSILMQTGARFILTSQGYSGHIVDTNCITIPVGRAQVNQWPERPAVSQLKNKLDSTAYIMFTSGSTGTPKGVIISNKAIATSCKEHGKVLQFSEKIRALQFAAYSFDASILEILTTLCFGGCVCVPSESDCQNDIVRAINDMRVNWMFQTPTVARTIPVDAVPDLHTIALGGEMVDKAEWDRWQSTVHVFGVFGPTETAIICHIYDREEHFQSGAIGRSIGSTGWIVDADNPHQLAPLGSVGELLVEGYTLADGYLDDIEKTKTAFIDNPAWLERVCGRLGRMYKTGDLCRYDDESGHLVYVGRKDNQIKIHGQRFELGEIERCVQVLLPELKYAVVELVQSGRKGLLPEIAVFVEQGNVEIALLSMEKSQEKLTHQLPASMIPTLYLAVSKFPISLSGKTNRTRLRQLANSRINNLLVTGRELHVSKRQPRGIVETLLHNVWCQVLRLEPEQIGVDDHFFQLGGDSVSAMKVVASLRARGETNACVADMFRHPRLLDFAMATRTQAKLPKPSQPFDLLDTGVDITLARKAVADKCNVEPESIDDIYQCSPLQEGMLSLTTDGEEYTMRILCELADHVDEKRLRNAWDDVVKSTGILHTRIVYCQLLGTVQALVNDIPLWSKGNDLEEYLRNDEKMPMRLNEPLTRQAMIQSSYDQKRWFVWTIHHALYDAWSLPRILGSLSRTYEGLEPEPRPAYRTFIQYLELQNEETTVQYWKMALEDCEATHFPPMAMHQLPPVADQTYSVEWDFTIKPQRARTTAATLVRASWAITQSRYTNQEDVVFGAVVSGRHARLYGIESIVGPTIATVPVRLQVTKTQSVVSFVDSVHDQTTRMIQFEQAGLQRIAKMSAAAKRACAFQTLLVVHTEDMHERSDIVGKWYCRGEMRGFSTYALILEILIRPEGLHFKVAFDGRALVSLQVRRVVEQFQFVLEQVSGAVASNDDSFSLASIDMLPQSHLNQISSRNAEIPLRIERCLHDLIGDRTAQQPDAPAIAAWDGHLSYQELDHASDKLAAYLRTHNIGNGTHVFVPICFEHSKWAVVAMLSVIKAGAAFVPLDPSHPRNRHLQILIDLHPTPTVILASSQSASLPHLGNYHIVVVGDVLLTSRTVPTSCPRFPDVDKEECRSASCKLGADGHAQLSEPKLQSNKEAHKAAAYVMFTSGSTGRPKGVIVAHSAISTSVLAHGKSLELDKRTRMLQSSSYCFDMCFIEIFAVLAYGGCVCIPSEDQRDPLGRTIYGQIDFIIE